MEEKEYTLFHSGLSQGAILLDESYLLLSNQKLLAEEE